MEVLILLFLWANKSRVFKVLMLTYNFFKVIFEALIELKIESLQKKGIMPLGKSWFYNLKFYIWRLRAKPLLLESIE